MNRIEIIKEWAKGCSCADHGRPWQCKECTVAMLRALFARRRNEG